MNLLEEVYQRIYDILDLEEEFEKISMVFYVISAILLSYSTGAYDTATSAATAVLVTAVTAIPGSLLIQAILTLVYRILKVIQEAVSGI